MRTDLRRGVPPLLLCLALSAGGAAAAQLPEKFTNLQVLPADIPQRELVGTMRGFALGLGVRCEHCHVGEPGQPLSSFDFAADDKVTKRTAREMLRMTRRINAQDLAAVPEELRTGLEVRCVTCHRGQERPALLEDVLDAAIAEGGAEAAVERYRALRGEHYGSHSFDFSELTLVMYAHGVAGRGEGAAAAALAELAVEHHPESAMAHGTLGSILLEQGDAAGAVPHLEHAVRLEPGNPRAEALLEKARAAASAEPPADPPSEPGAGSGDGSGSGEDDSP